VRLYFPAIYLRRHLWHVARVTTYCPQITSWSLRSINVFSAVRGEYKACKWAEEFLLVSDKEWVIAQLQTSGSLDCIVIASFIYFFDGRMFLRWVVTSITFAPGTLHCRKTRIPCGDKLVMCGLYVWICAGNVILSATNILNQVVSIITATSSSVLYVTSLVYICGQHYAVFMDSL
jgi:hypothetical protein